MEGGKSRPVSPRSGTFLRVSRGASGLADQFQLWQTFDQGARKTRSLLREHHCIRVFQSVSQFADIRLRLGKYHHLMVAQFRVTLECPKRVLVIVDHCNLHRKLPFIISLSLVRGSLGLKRSWRQIGSKNTFSSTRLLTLSAGYGFTPMRVFWQLIDHVVIAVDDHPLRFAHANKQASVKLAMSLASRLTGGKQSDRDPVAAL